MKFEVPIDEFIAHPVFLNDQSLSIYQRAAIKGGYGLKLTDEELEAFLKLSERGRYVSGKEESEWTLIFGRQSGKTDKILSNVALYESFRFEEAPVGTLPTAMIVSTEQRRQSRVAFHYCLRKLENSRELRRFVRSATSSEIRLANGTLVSIFPCNQARIRGSRLLFFGADEVSFWRVEGVNIDRDVLDSARPALNFPNSKMIKATTPYMNVGEVAEDFRLYFGKESAPVYVLKGKTSDLNPSLFSKARVQFERLRLRNQAVFRSEFEAEFRADLSAMYLPEAIEEAVERGRREYAYRDGERYVAFVDSAGGGGKDSFAIAIGHREKDRIVVDVVRARRPKFNPLEVAREFAELVKGYGIRKVIGDAYSGDFGKNAFEESAVRYEKCGKPKSELYLFAESLFNVGKVALPDDETLVGQLKSLVRRTRSGGKDSVDTSQGQPEDVANVAVGVLYLLSSKPTKSVFYKQYPFGMSPDDRGGEEDDDLDLIRESSFNFFPVSGGIRVPDGRRK